MSTGGRKQCRTCLVRPQRGRFEGFRMAILVNHYAAPTARSWRRVSRITSGRSSSASGRGARGACKTSSRWKTIGWRERDAKGMRWKGTGATQIHGQLPSTQRQEHPSRRRRQRDRRMGRAARRGFSSEVGRLREFETRRRTRHGSWCGPSKLWQSRRGPSSSIGTRQGRRLREPGVGAGELACRG